MGRHQETTAEILAGFRSPSDCNIKCRLCGVKVADDDPSEMWQGFKPGLGANGFAIDEHVKCDALAKQLEVHDFESKVDAYLSAAGDERARAERVLAWRRGTRYV